MIRMIATTSAGHAKSYFTSALQPTDYYINEQELQGRFYGLLSDRLGITGVTDRDTFFSLVDNRHPLTGEILTVRNKERRTIFYDISWHCPKSVSLVHALSGDDHILNAFLESVRDTVKEMERDLLTRVRRKGKDEDREAGEMLIAEFVHQTARPAHGAITDPHLHAHLAVFNVTMDHHEGRFKAGQFREIARSLPYYQQRYHKRLANNLMALGYKVRKTRSAFEIEGVDPHILELFSKRTSEIGIFASEHGITGAKELDQLGARTRGAKQKDLSMTELKAEWRRQIREASIGRDIPGDTIIRHKDKIVSPVLAPHQCVHFAAQHSFERLSTISDRRLLESAYRRAVCNNSVTLEDIDNAFKQDNSFIHVKDGYQNIVTTKEVLAEEKEMVMLARNGQGRFNPLYKRLPDITLDGQQRNAIERVLSTTNLVSIIRGVAGAGKTTALTELDKHLKAAGIQPTYVAPNAVTVHDVLRKEGFSNADTVAMLLKDKTLQDRLENQFLIVDESGMLGSKDMRDLLALATRKKARLILVGDDKQHSAVQRGDALRVLSKIGKIQSTEISKIRRQRNEKYREAVQDLAEGNVNKAFGKLANINAVRQIDPLHPNAELVADYVDKAKRGKSLLVVSPTNKQGHLVTKDLRSELQNAGLLHKKEVAALKLTNLNLTQAQKTDWRNYQAGQIIQFSLPAPQIRRGSVWKIEAVQDGNIVLTNKSGQKKALPLDKAKAFDLFELSTINIAKGDKIRITKGGNDKQEKRLNNGQTFDVVSINKAGEIKVRNKESKSIYILDTEFGHIDHAYCTTSHSSQGKTCDEVLISMPASTFPAADAKQIYVSVSRGRDMVTIYTDDKEQLLEHAERAGDRRSALELLEQTKTRHRYPPPIQRNIPATKTIQPIENKSVNRSRHIDYEP